MNIAGDNQIVNIWITAGNFFINNWGFVGDSIMYIFVYCTFYIWTSRWSDLPLFAIFENGHIQGWEFALSLLSLTSLFFNKSNKSDSLSSLFTKRAKRAICSFCHKTSDSHEKPKSVTLLPIRYILKSSIPKKLLLHFANIFLLLKRTVAKRKFEDI